MPDNKGFGLVPVRNEGDSYNWQDRMTRLGEDEETAKRRAAEEKLKSPQPQTPPPDSNTG